MKIRLLLASLLLACSAFAQVNISGGVIISGGTIQSVAPSGFAPLFTTLNPTTNPSFVSSAFAGHGYFGNCGNVSAVPGVCLISTSDVSPNLFAADVGTVNVLAVNLAAPATVYTGGLIVETLPAFANTISNPTLNVNGLGALAIKKLGPTGEVSLVNGDYSPNAYAVFVLNGTTNNWELQNPLTGNGTLTSSGSPGSTSVPGFTTGSNIAPINNVSYDTTGLIGNMNLTFLGRSSAGSSPICFITGTTGYQKISDCVSALNALGATGTGVIVTQIPEDINYPTLFATNPKSGVTIYLSTDLGLATDNTCAQTAPFNCWLVTGPLIMPTKFSIRSLAGPTTVNPSGGTNSGSILSWDTASFPAPIGSMTGAGATLGSPTCNANGGNLSNGVYKVAVTLVNNLMTGASNPKTPGRGSPNIPTDEKSVTCANGGTAQSITWSITNAPARVTTGYGAQDAAAYITCVSGSCASVVTAGGSNTETEAGDPTTWPTGCNTAIGLIDQDGGACRLPASTGTLTFTITNYGGKNGGPAPPYGTTDHSNPMIVLGTGPDTGAQFDVDLRDIFFNGSPSGVFLPPANEPNVAILGYTGQEHSGCSVCSFGGAFTSADIYSGYNSNNSTYSRISAGSSQGPNQGNFYTAICDGRMLSGGCAIDWSGTFAAHCTGSVAGTCGGSGGSGIVNPAQILVTGGKAFPHIQGHTESAGSGSHGIQVTNQASAVIDGYDGFSSSAVTQLDSTAGHVHVCVHNDDGAANKVMINDSANSYSQSTVIGYEMFCYDSGTTYMAAMATGQINQLAANNFAGSCSMSGSTTCTYSTTASFSSYLAFASLDPVATVPATANSAKCSLSAGTVTITAGISNSLKWDCLLIGNPN